MTRAEAGTSEACWVLGAAIGLSPAQVSPFLSSLRGSGYRGGVALLADRRLVRALRGNPLAAGVTLITAPQWLPFKLRLLERPRTMRILWEPLQAAMWTGLRALRAVPLPASSRARLQRMLAQWLYTPMETRFLRYQTFLASVPHGRVLLTDVRDVLFQGDPFACMPARGLAVSIETCAYTLASQPHNARWIERVYGPRMLERIGERRVSCVGVTYGDAQAVSRYLCLFAHELLRLPPHRAGIGGADTAIHNVLLWTDRLGQVAPLETLAGPVATLNGIDEGQVRVSAEGRLLNTDGSEPSVLHQYDRLRGVREGLLQSLASCSLD